MSTEQTTAYPKLQQGLSSPLYDSKRSRNRETSSPSRSICRYLKVSIWHSEAMYALPCAGQARFLYLYLLTGPHTLGYHVPGIYQVGKQALREATSLNAQEFSKAMIALRDRAGMQTDFVRGLIWLPSALEHLGPPANPNIVRGYCKAIQSMPKSRLLKEAIAAYGPFLANLGEDFVKPFAERFPEVQQMISKPLNIDKREDKKEIQKKENPIPTNKGNVAHIRSILKNLS